MNITNDENPYNPKLEEVVAEYNTIIKKLKNEKRWLKSGYTLLIDLGFGTSDLYRIGEGRI